MGSWASRSMVVAGSAALEAARRLREQALHVAAELLEAAPGDLEVSAGGVAVRGAAARRVSWSEIVARAGGDGRDGQDRSEEHTSELQSRENLVCRLLLEKK